MSARSSATAKQSARQRKVCCEACGYTIRVARSWLEVGLPVCPCGQPMRPTAIADLVFLGLMGQDEMPAREWTAVCRELGWEDLIVRRGAAYQAYVRSGKDRIGGRDVGRGDPAAHCAHPGCGLWVAAGAVRCGAGHLQDGGSIDVDVVSIPF